MNWLIITRGLPGAGKTTLAEQWRDRAPRRARVSRGVLRDLIAGGGRWEASEIGEDVLGGVERTMISLLLSARMDVIVDDTNLADEYVRVLERIADLHGARFLVVDLTDVPPGVCLTRNASRQAPDFVPRDWITRAYEKHVAGRPHPLPYEFSYGGRQITPAALLGEDMEESA